MTPQEAIAKLTWMGYHDMATAFRELVGDVEACKKLLGYEDGDGTLLNHVTRFKAYADSEIKQAWAGAEKLKDALDKAYIANGSMTARDCVVEHDVKETLAHRTCFHHPEEDLGLQVPSPDDGNGG